MPDKVIDIPGVGPTAFPDSMSDQEINAAATRVYQDANPGKKQPPVTSWAGTSVPAAAISQALPSVANVAAEFGTNPNVPKIAANIGRAVGGMTSLPAGQSGFGSIQKGAYAGGKSGWFTGKMLQDLARPASTAMEAAAPVATALSGALGGGDLAQMDDPKRQDIGTLGVGPTDVKASDQASVMGAQIRALMAQGKSAGDATRTVYNAWAKFLSEQRK
jgi:hypothetical protein